MSQATFLGTPLTKYEIDDIEVDFKRGRAREFFESKELLHKHNRERIRKNRRVDLYTVDTKEGWTPRHFKSSRSHRATYDFQRIDHFTDLEDSDIISREVLKSLAIEQKSQEISRIVKGILHNYGYLERRVFGPQLPTEENRVIVRQAADYKGVGFVGSLYDEDEECKENVSQVENVDDRLKWVPSKEIEYDAPEEKKNSSLKMIAYHKYDRDLDLQDIKQYYSTLFDFIVKPLELIAQDKTQDLLEQYAKKMEFTTEAQEDKKEIKTGRTEIKYEFSPELLRKFNIKSQVSKAEMDTQAPGTISQDEQEQRVEFEVPQELFIKIFGK